MTPVVGLSCYRQEAAWGAWRRPAALLATAYVDVVAAAGGRPVLLPPFSGQEGTSTGAAEVVAALAALVLVGGEDVGDDPMRDRNETALLAAALAAGLPVLAVCRGHQLLNVHLGGSLFPHLPDVVSESHRPAPGSFAEVPVRAASGSRVAKAMGESFSVSCSHHQAIDRPAESLSVTARSAGGAIEAVEHVSAPFVVGVQWHPEEQGDPRMFRALVEATGR